MQNKRYDLDDLIINSFENLNVNKNYNEKLMQKLHKRQIPNAKKENLVPSLALIAAGLFIIFLNITSLQVQMTKFESYFANKFIAIEINQDSIFNFIKQLGE